jgi:hypothetical protein
MTPILHFPAPNLKTGSHPADDTNVIIQYKSAEGLKSRNIPGLEERIGAMHDIQRWRSDAKYLELATATVWSRSSL